MPTFALSSILVSMADETNKLNLNSETGTKSDGDDTISRATLSFASKKIHPMEALLKNYGNKFFLKRGDIVEGVILEKTGPQVFVDLGALGVGIIYGRELYIAEDIIKKLNVGDPITVKVVEIDNEDGYVELSLREVGEERKWIELKRIMETGTALELPVLEANRGGLILEAEGVKGFLPASQLSSKNYPRVEGGDKEKVYQQLQKLVGTKLRVKIIDVSPGENKLIFSEREVNQDLLRLELSKFKIGDEVEGEITGVVDFGAFMKFRSVKEEVVVLLDETKTSLESERPKESLGSSEDENQNGKEKKGETPQDNSLTEIEGLIHISEIDWTLVEDPREVLKPGDKVRAKIIDIQGDKVSLSLKALKDDPWEKLAEKYKKGDTIHGKVTKYNAFGTFVEVGDKIQGLVHISEFGTEAKMKEALEIGKEYDFKILLIDPPEHRMSLGMIRDEKNTQQRTTNTNQTQNPDLPEI